MPKKQTDLSLLGGRLRAYRKRKGLTLKKLEALTSIAQATLSEVENARYELSGEKLGRIIRNTDINPIWLLTGEGPMFATPMKTPAPQPDHSTQPDHSPLNVPDLLNKAQAVLVTNTRTAQALALNIEEFYERITGPEGD